MSGGGRKLVEELCQTVHSFLCQPGAVIDLEKCPIGHHVFSKGDSSAICTVRLKHGAIYNVEFLYKFWAHKLQGYKYPFCPCFIISNNGLATTLKCFLCEPRDISTQFGTCLPMAPDVTLRRNESILLRQDDFIKFKTPLVFAKDLDIVNSMVVCRTYLTDYKHSLQFLVVKAKNQRRVSNILNMIADANQPAHPTCPEGLVSARRSIKDARGSYVGASGTPRDPAVSLRGPRCGGPLTQRRCDPDQETVACWGRPGQWRWIRTWPLLWTVVPVMALALIFVAWRI
ncbi:nuclear egress membrane protein [Common bottlenose dolphin gammaherpesvirus 1 strain Sarasota]|uniref:Nuclear egress membrane protein n=1 Tax=Common bottlenose dolphin gammaherpesvirus 1 strain Sarasota TaxID=2022783 RepID=A0A1Z1NEA4_9GAMA|nr:nuclear egress membrane protein [Common bottlenose dolphin gammaherpesvirus 1 strain Sarasota]ARW78129.1 nuclear egress membrane protein [Common bottlenose dolphin gammaherpesvirus 1 strain Sarasota]